MSYDLYATFPCTNDRDVTSIVGNEKLDIATRIQLLAPALITQAKDIARTGDKRSGGGYKSLVFADDPEKAPFAQKLIVQERQKRMQPLGLWQPSPPPFALLPPYAAFIQFTFTLAKPYISRDDEPFHINDNPVRKDKVFKVPMVAPTSWKGNLRWTARQLEPRIEPETMLRLFGPEKGDEETHLAGALHFYPTFLNRIGLEVINPHDRKTRAGTKPIYFECVPEKAEGTFSLLYVPLPGSVSEEQARDDLQTVATAIAAMMLTYGFSAKKSSGYGEAEDGIEAGHIYTIVKQDGYPIAKLSELEKGVAHVTWS